jgi:hypothetical protein
MLRPKHLDDCKDPNRMPKSGTKSVEGYRGFCKIKKFKSGVKVLGYQYLLSVLEIFRIKTCSL